MPRYAAFLRGMNLGRRRVRNEELVEAFEAMGLANASAFLASGNVVFDAGGRGAKSPGALRRRIEDGLLGAFDYAVPTFIRSAAEIQAIAECDAKPLVGESDGKPQIVLLQDSPSPAARKAILELATSDDRLAWLDRELLWRPAGPMSRSELDVRAIEKLAGGVMTIRTVRTIERMAAKHFSE